MEDGLSLRDFSFLGWGPITLVLPVGSVGGVSGASGSGKSLFFRGIADLLDSSGHVFWRGQRCADIPAPQWRQRVGLLPANPVWWYDRVGEHFRGNVSERLSRLGFDEDVLKWDVARLSSGEKQRLALVRLLDREPECLLLDEPTANLDSGSADKVLALIQSYLLEQKAVRSILLVSHNTDLLEEISTRQWRMENRHLHRLESHPS